MSENFPSEESCDEFQEILKAPLIIDIWKKFRESPNSENGKITKCTFQKIMKKHFEIPDELLVDAIFERFKLEKTSDKQDTEQLKNHLSNQSTIHIGTSGIKLHEEQDQILIQDLVISLIILSKMDKDKKLRLIFKITDVDEDECLSIEDIQLMIRKIWRNFERELFFTGGLESLSLLNELAFNKSERIQKWTILSIQQSVNKDDSLKNEEKDNNNNQFFDEKLITEKEFYDCIKKKESLIKSLLPDNYKLSEVLRNKIKERHYKIQGTGRSKDDFYEFRNLLHASIRNFYKDKTSEQYIKNQKEIKFPGKVEFVDYSDQNKSVYLFNSEKLSKKKMQVEYFSELKDKFKNFNQFLNPYQEFQRRKNEEEQQDKNVSQKSHNTDNLEKNRKRLQNMREDKDKYDLKLINHNLSNIKYNQ